MKCVVADLPFGAARPKVFEQRILRYPLKEIVDYIDGDDRKREEVMNTMSYFDTVNLATRCEVPTLLTLGERDPAVRPFEVESIFEVLPGQKRMERLDWGHDWHPSMVNRNRDWMLSHV